MGKWERDPLSVLYDDIAWQVMLRAIRAGRRGAAVRIWIASPRAEYSRLDGGGYTAHERAFTRACYHLLTGPRSSDERPVREYALKKPAVVAGPVTSRQGVMARQLRLRVWPQAQARHVTGEKSYIDNLELRHWQGEAS